MLRVRFHGRGGHGVKTASRILGTAAFLEGWQVQDFPIYGTERRGAAVAAFTRIDGTPILERGVIVQPDYLIIADETLLRDESAGALAGMENVSAVFVNSARDLQAILAEVSLPGTVKALDLTSLAGLGRTTNLSAALGAAACAITGVSSAAMTQAVRTELSSLGLATEIVDRNTALAQQVFAMLQPVIRREQNTASPVTPLRPPKFEPGPLAVPIIYNVGNATARQTGAWRIVRPVIDLSACTRCMICLARCPDGVIALDDRGSPKIDYDHCKGCMICAQECPLRCIHEEKEVRT